MMWLLRYSLVWQFVAALAVGAGAVTPAEVKNEAPSLISRLRALNKKISIVRKLRAVAGLGGNSKPKSIATAETINTHYHGVKLAIVRPFTHGQISSMLSSFDKWTKYPLGQNGCAGYDMDVILSYSGEDNKSIESQEVHEAFATIRSLHSDTNKWGGCVRSVELMFANIPPSEDQYSDYHASDGSTNKFWVNGPNRQFERMFRFVEQKKKYDLWYLMEPDSHPIKSLWLDDLISEITELSPFAILGSKYDGNAWDDFAADMPLDLLHHINGNAVYNVTNPLLLQIVSELESESRTDFNAIPFDLRISQMMLEGSTGKQCAFIFDSSIELPNKVKKFESWWKKYASEYDPLKESSTLSNQAAMVFTSEETNGASIVHGKNEFQLWNSADHGSITLVIQAHPGFDREALLSVLGLNGMNYFSEVVIMSDDKDIDVDYGRDGDLPLQIKIQTRTSPKSMDVCQAQISSNWFMIIDDKFQCADDMQVLVSTDGKQRPLQALNPSGSESCRKSKFCVDLMANVRQVYPAMNSFVLSNDALFHRFLRDEFCAWFGQNMDIQILTENVNEHSTTTSVSMATSYFAFLYKIKATEVYDLKDKTKFGIRNKFVRRIEVPRSLMENVAEISSERSDTRNSLPFFWHIPKSGGTSVKDSLTECLGLASASGFGTMLEKYLFAKENKPYYGPKELRVLPGNHVNVDVTREVGIKQAAELGLVESGIAQVIVSPSLEFAIENLFPKTGRQAAIFAVFRHPIERAASLFYYLQVADWERSYDPSLKNLTIVEWVASQKAENNWLVRSVLGDVDIPEITSYHFEAAKEFIDKKVLVGLTSDLDESMNRFRHYFQWDETSAVEGCISDMLNGKQNENKHEKIMEGSKEWNALTEINKWDIALYDHIQNTWRTQGSRLFTAQLHIPKSDEIDGAMESIASIEYQRLMQEYPGTPQLWYPDWDGENKGCINDENGDVDVSTKYKTLAECCTKHYQWDWNACMGTNPAVRPDGSVLYYPDWDGDNKSCKNDGNQPTYMSNNVNAWMYKDLQSCCIARYTQNVNVCMGSSAESAGTGKWFVDSQQLKCVQDCIGPSPCGGLSDGWETTYDTAAACCTGKLWWLNKGECVFDSTGDPNATPEGSNKFYVNWDTYTCVQDCVGSAPCGGLADSWEVLYASKAACCNDKLSWVADCLQI